MHNVPAWPPPPKKIISFLFVFLSCSRGRVCRMESCGLTCSGEARISTTQQTKKKCPGHSKTVWYPWCGEKTWQEFLFFKVVLTGLACTHLSYWLFHDSAAKPQKLFEQKAGAATSFVGPSVRWICAAPVPKLFRIQKKATARRKPSSCTRCKPRVRWKELDPTHPPGSGLHHLLPVIRGELLQLPEPHFPHLKREANNLHLSSLTLLPGFFFFFKSQAWIILFNMFSIFLWGKEREVFQWGVSGRKAIWWIKCGSFKDEGRGPRGAAFLASPTWHTLPRSGFLLACIPSTSVAGVMKPVADLTQAAGLLSRGSCCHAEILKWPRLLGLLLSQTLGERPLNS